MHSLPQNLDFSPILSLFDESQDYIYIKDLKGRFLFSNASHLRLMGVDRLDQIVGKTDFDFVLPFLALRFQQQEREVFQGKQLLRQVELLSKDGDHSFWHLTTKLPLKSVTGSIVGLIGYSRNLQQEGLEQMVSSEIRRCLHYFRENFSDKIKMSSLSKIACLSMSALERRFQKEVGMTPTSYLKNLRMNDACRKLSETQEPIAKIALESGFCDQAYFTAEFRRSFHITPLQYRKNLFLSSRNKR